MRNFFRCWLVHSFSKVLSACKILDGGVTPSPRYGEETGFAILNIARCNACSPSWALGEWLVSGVTQAVLQLLLD